MSSWRQLWHVELLGNELGAWVVALLIFLVTFAVLPLATRFIARQRRVTPVRAPQVQFALDLAPLLLAHTSRVFLWAVALWLASRDLTLPPRLERWFMGILVVLFWMQMAHWAMTAVRFSMDQRRLRLSGQDTLLKSSMQVILFAARLLIWGIAALLALDNLGVEIGPLLAGLGIGGIALALAVQAILGDLLASLSIALDRPFAIGDFLGVDDFQGRVEYIGVKSTRLRSISGEEIIVSNADILKSRVRNFGRLQERRALFRLNLHYETPVATLAAVPRAIREIIEATPDTRFERCHLLNCGENALQFEVVYFVTRPEFSAYADAQQRINLRILERFSTMELKFAAVIPTPVRVQFESPAPADSGGQQRLL